VLKKPRYAFRKKGELTKVGERFVNEARETQALAGNDGVIRVLDVAPGPEPDWYVCELATPLAEHLGGEPNLWDVVAVVADVADTLADLAERKIFHRDIKPDNLLHARGRAIVADFGIAAWPDVARVTKTGEKVGPAHFLAPEMRADGKDARPGPADVYALAKTLFVLANPDLGDYPPPGRHDAERREFSLYRAGQRTAHEIEALLEWATEHRPAYRPTMRQFAGELRDWLSITEPTAAVRPKHPAFRRGIGPEMQAEVALIARRKRALIDRLRRVGDDLAKSAGTTDWQNADADLLLGVYEPVGPPDDGPDVFECFVSGSTAAGRRAVLAGAMWHSTVTYFAEVQTGSADDPALAWRLDPIVEAELEQPSGRARLREVALALASALG
jgi:hypothetical protein